MSAVDAKSAALATIDDVVAETDADAQQLELLLEDFYAFMYEKAVLVGPTGTSPSKAKGAGKGKPGAGSPTRACFCSNSKRFSYNVSVGVSVDSGGYGRFAATKDAQGKWQRMVGMAPASRVNTQRLQETFDQLLEQYQARMHAICPVREKFFLQVFG
ncbi:hypothetical protein BBP00_00010046 [Phytophthora kernoviae]|uniref:Uncharacterized protein n=1 Tax=Phytophthora kernoviae TaxID=325452 RepID=A0A3F2RAU1_9STRA|nr:hypothetical protein BBP00_00010046 [Phytophthora kernoviae]